MAGEEGCVKENAALFLPCTVYEKGESRAVSSTKTSPLAQVSRSQNSCTYRLRFAKLTSGQRTKISWGVRGKCFARVGHTSRQRQDNTEHEVNKHSLFYLFRRRRQTLAVAARHTIIRTFCPPRNRSFLLGPTF